MKEKLFSPVVSDGIMGNGVFSVLSVGVAVVNGTLIFMTGGRCKLCGRTVPVDIITKERNFNVHYKIKFIN